MVSAFSNPNMPPLMAPEAEQAGLMSIGKANFQENMKNPAKQKVMTAMMGQALEGMGKGLFGAPQLPDRQPRFDMYGNPLG